MVRKVNGVRETVRDRDGASLEDDDDRVKDVEMMYVCVCEKESKKNVRDLAVQRGSDNVREGKGRKEGKRREEGEGEQQGRKEDREVKE